MRLAQECCTLAFADPRNAIADRRAAFYGRKPVPWRDRRGPGACPTLDGDLPIMIWICDVNGVLIDAAAIVCQAFAATAARYRFPFRAREFHAIKGLRLIDAYRILDPGSDAGARRMFHLRYIRERVAELRAFPDVRDTLAAARAAGVRIGAATSHGEIAEACLVHTGLYPFIDCLVTAEEVKRPKPHPDSLLRILTLLGTDPRQADADAAVHVGDTLEDVEAGRAARIRTIGVTYGMSQEAEIRAAEPDFVIHAFREMQSWIAGPASQTLPMLTFGDAADRASGDTHDTHP